MLTPELADAQTPNIAALPTRADPVAVAEAAWEKACDAETAAWEAYYEHGAPLRWRGRRDPGHRHRRA